MFESVIGGLEDCKHDYVEMRRSDFVLLYNTKIRRSVSEAGYVVK